MHTSKLPKWFWTWIEECRPDLDKLAERLESASREDVITFAQSYCTATHAAYKSTLDIDLAEGMSEQKVLNFCTWLVAQGKARFLRTWRSPVLLRKSMENFRPTMEGPEDDFRLWSFRKSDPKLFGFRNPEYIAFPIFENRFGEDLFAIVYGDDPSEERERPPEMVFKPFWRWIEECKPDLNALVVRLEAADKDDIFHFARSYGAAFLAVHDRMWSAEDVPMTDIQKCCDWIVSQGKSLFDRTVNSEIEPGELLRLFRESASDPNHQYAPWSSEGIGSAYRPYAEPGLIAVPIYRMRFHEDLFERMERTQPEP